MSLARRHRESVLAAQAAGQAAASVTGAAPMPTEGAVATEYQLLLAALGVDLNELRNIESIERKIEAKRHKIERYRPWVEGALSAEGAVQDDIVATLLVWAIDIGDWSFALDIAAHVLHHGIALPERYKRKPPTLIAEEFAEAGLKAPPAIDLATLQLIEALVQDEDMHDQVRAKLQKAIGLAFAARAEAFDPEADSAPAGGKAALVAAALDHFRRALELDDKCGVKKLIEVLDREAKKSAVQGESK